jgi:transitional endoplasmic reticulum ATPase
MASYDPDTFTFIERDLAHSNQVYDDYTSFHSGVSVDTDVRVQASLRQKYPNLTLTAVPNTNCNFLLFAGAGHASARLDVTSGNVLRFRGYIASETRGKRGRLGSATRFAKYHYRWLREEFILYTVQIGGMMVNYILHRPDEGEGPFTHSRATDALIEAVGAWQQPDEQSVYVYDQGWSTSRALWEQVQKVQWEDVILDEGVKGELAGITEKFFESRAEYESLGVPWKRGVIWHGPPGNGKTICIK